MKVLQRSAALAWPVAALLVAAPAPVTRGPRSTQNEPQASQEREISPQATARRSRVLEQYAQLPLYFEPNVGQTDPRVQFLARSRGSTLFLTSGEAVMVLSQRSKGEQSSVDQAVVRMKLEGADRKTPGVGLERLPGLSAYFRGKDPAQWRPEVPHYGRVEYKGIYPGVDLVYYSNQNQVEYDFVVAPGADPGRIRLIYTGPENMRVDDSGDLVLATRVGELKQHKPRVYQQVGSERVEVAAHYRLEGKRVGVELAAYDRERPLYIDPVLTYSTYLGGNSYDEAYGIAVDSTGAAYVAGYTWSPNFPSVNAQQALFGGGSTDAFVAKLNPYGGSGPITLAYCTFLGGIGDDSVNAIAVDAAGAAYLAGYTNSNNFPTVNAYQAAYQGADSTSDDVFVAKVNPYGGSGPVTLAFSTYLGGSGYEHPHGIAVNSAGAAYVAGYTTSTNFPTVNAYQTTLRGFTNAFVTKLNPYGGGTVTLAYSTYLGGSNYDYARAITLDNAGAAYVAGYTNSSNFPLISSQQLFLAGGIDAFVTKLNPYGGSGTVTLAYSIYLGGAGNDLATAIGVDTLGAAYIAGQTASANFPVINAYQSTFSGGSNDAFVTKLNPYGGSGGVTLAYSTYLGGGGDDLATAIAVDTNGAAHVAGSTSSGDFPGAGAPQNVWAGNYDAFVVRMNPHSGSGPVALGYSTYLGGTLSDQGNAVAVDASGSVYVVGGTDSTNFPIVKAYQATQGGLRDAFVARLAQPLRFVPVTPCRVADTRNATNKLGYTGSRNFPVAGVCGVPTQARAYSLNVSAIPRATLLGFLAIWPAGQAQPVVSTLNSYDARVKANAAFVPAGLNGAISVFLSDAADVFLDINGYFVPAETSPDALVYFPVTPCRVMDTRTITNKLGFAGTYTVPMTGSCGLPATAHAFAVNFTVIPRTNNFSFLSAWPHGQPQPGVSTLNAFNTGGALAPVTANAAVVPAGDNGSVDVYHTDVADLLIDVSGYFDLPGAGGLSFYTAAPCRAVDTRTATNKVGFSGTQSFALPASTCGLPAASAYSLSATALPRPQLDFLALWPTGGTQPGVSTLNSFDGSVVSNAAIVPANATGSISAFNTQPADLLLDVNGYFAP